jgi:hypothetical protein
LSKINNESHKIEAVGINSFNQDTLKEIDKKTNQN